MSLKKDYINPNCSKLISGPGGWRCISCNPYRCHPRKMKKLARRRVRRTNKIHTEE